MPESRLYRDPIQIWHHWYFQRWGVTVAVLILIFLCLSLALYAWQARPDRSGCEDEAGRESKKIRARRSIWLSFWTVVVGFSSLIWIDSVYCQYGSGWAIGFVLVAVLVLVSTFVLEGLEVAYTELRDKDKRQFSGRAAKVFQNLCNMDQKKKSFYEAREWSIVALVVITTLMVETDVYRIPKIGYISAGDGTAGHAMRIALSLVLSTVPFVWLAQGPGKYIARRNSVQFLRYRWTRLTVWTLENVVWRAMKSVGLEYPSDVTDALALSWFKKSKRERGLPPSEFSFFADAVKKYGYGVPLSDDVITIRDNGSCEVYSRLLAYIVMPRTGVSRRFEFENGFEAETVDGLQCADPSRTKWWAFRGPMIGERVTDELLDRWAELFYHEDPENWRRSEYKKHDASAFMIVPELTELIKPQEKEKSEETDEIEKKKVRPTQQLNVKLNFRGLLPEREEGKSAFLVLWEVRLNTNAGTVELPEKWGDSKPYPYSKMHSHPSLRSTITFCLPEPKAPDSGAIFVEPTSRDHFMVSYDNIFHLSESKRFKEQQRPYLEKAPSKNMKPGERKFVYYIDSSLPAALYNVELCIEKKSPLPLNKGNAGLAAAAPRGNATAATITVGQDPAPTAEHRVETRDSHPHG